MTHYSRLGATCVDVAGDNHEEEIAFWQGACGRELQRDDEEPEYHGAHWPGQEVLLLVQRLGSGEPRVHLDLQTDDMDAEVARLEQLGARQLRRLERWCVMQDPAGLLFCVVVAGPGLLSEDNAMRWD
jgi:hypothetical protein